jgi:tetratricopeptide (TPR) repeat protein
MGKNKITNLKQLLFLTLALFCGTANLHAQPKPEPTATPNTSPTLILETTTKIRNVEVTGVSPKTQAELSNAAKLMQDGKHEESIAAHTRIIKAFPNLIVAYNNRGYSYSQSGKLDLAIADFDYALKLSPSYITYDNRGAAFLKKDNLAKALADFSKAIQLNPKGAVSYSNRAAVYLRMQDFQSALADQNKAISLAPKEAVYLSNRCYTHYQLKSFEQALKDCSDAIQLSAKSVLTYGTRGAIYLSLSSYESALADYDEAIKLGGDQLAINYSNRGFALMNLNRLDEAAESLTKSIAARPSVIAYLYRAKVYERLNQPASEAADLNNAVALEPNNPISYNNRGIYHLKRADRDAALSDFNRAIELNPKIPLAYRNRAFLYRQTGEIEKAQADEKTAATLEAAPLK